MGTHRWLTVGIFLILLVPPSAEGRGVKVDWIFSGIVLQNVPGPVRSPR